MAVAADESVDIDQLYRSHGRALWAIFYGETCDRHLALDAVQEAFLRLHERQTAGYGNVVGWLVQTGRNWLRDRGRKDRRQSAFTSDDSFADSAVSPEQLALGNELNHQIREGLLELDVTEREILALRYSLDWNSARIAETLGCSTAAVDMRLSRARKRLAAKLVAAGVENGSV